MDRNKRTIFYVKKKIGVSEATYKIANTTYINIEDIRECLQIFDKNIEEDSDDEQDELDDETKYNKWRSISAYYYEMLEEHNNDEDEAVYETAQRYNMQIDEVNELVYTYV